MLRYLGRTVTVMNDVHGDQYSSTRKSILDSRSIKHVQHIHQASSATEGPEAHVIQLYRPGVSEFFTPNLRGKGMKRMRTWGESPPPAMAQFQLPNLMGIRYFRRDFHSAVCWFPHSPHKTCCLDSSKWYGGTMLQNFAPCSACRCRAKRSGV